MGILAAIFLSILVLRMAPLPARADAYVYSAGPRAANFGNRSAARTICNAAKPGAIPACSGTVVPLALYSGETLAGITAGLTGAARAQNGSVIASSFGSPYLAADLSGYFPRHWSGMTAAGTAMQRGTCLDWTVTSSKAKAGAGWKRPSYFAATCSRTLDLLCGCGIAATKSPTTALRLLR